MIGQSFKVKKHQLSEFEAGGGVLGNCQHFEVKQLPKSATVVIVKVSKKIYKKNCQHVRNFKVKFGTHILLQLITN